MTIVRSHVGGTGFAAAVRILPSASWILPLACIALLSATAIVEPRFLSPLNLVNLSRNASYLVVIGTGQMIVMILGGMDLSIGAMVALSSITTAIVMNRAVVWWPGHDVLATIVGVGAALAVSAAGGLVNGLCVAKAHASAFMVTLGMFSVLGGVSYYATAGIPIYGMPTGFTNGFGRGTLAGVPYSVFVALGLVLVMLVVQRRTHLGRYFYAIGGSVPAARLSGLPVSRYIIAAYVSSSLLAGVTGILLTARIGAGQATLGSEYMLLSIGVAVIAGVSMRGGTGRVEMLLLSGIFLTVIANAMNLVRINSKVQTVVFGVVLLAAAVLDRRKNRRGHDE